jgi:WD40 repeat protein
MVIVYKSGAAFYHYSEYQSASDTMSVIPQFHRFDLNIGQITKPCWSPDGRFLALPTRTGSIGIFDIVEEKLVKTLGPHSGEVTAVTWNRKSAVIMTGSLDRSIGLWDVESGQRAPVNISGHKEPVHSIEWTDEEAFAMTCSADRVRALDGCCLLTGWTTEMENAVNRYSRFTSAACSCQTTFLLALSAENGSRLVLASLISGVVLESIPMSQAIRCVAWSPAEELLAVGAGDTIIAFRATQTGFEGSPREITRHAAKTYALSFSCDGTILASHDTEGLKIWDVRTSSLLATYPEKTEAIFTGRSSPGIAFHPTEQLLATVAPDGNEIRILEPSKLNESGI